LQKLKVSLHLLTQGEMACYAGVVPFDHQSGTSVKYKSKVSIYADKELKEYFAPGGDECDPIDNELRVYYLRKLKKAKNKMSVLNSCKK
jgi:hypothetical protein